MITDDDDAALKMQDNYTTFDLIGLILHKLDVITEEEEQALYCDVDYEFLMRMF